MPILNGWETTKKIHELKRKKELKKVPPIIGFTAHISDNIMEKCYESGMVDVIVKPCPKEEILTKLMHWIQ